MAALPHLRDVSSWQGPIDWRAERRAGVRYVYCKVSQGTTYVDPTGARRIRNASWAGLHAGGYHFATPGVGSPEAQAARLLELAPHRKGMLRPCVDCEWNEHGLEPAALAAWYLGFVVSVHKRTGFWPAVYGSPSYLARFAVYHPDVFGRCPLWLADYGVARPKVPAPWSHWAAWQWTDRRYDPAAGSRVDDSFVADAAALLVPGPLARARARRRRA